MLFLTSMPCGTGIRQADLVLGIVVGTEHHEAGRGCEGQQALCSVINLVSFPENVGEAGVAQRPACSELELIHGCSSPGRKGLFSRQRCSLSAGPLRPSLSPRCRRVGGSFVQPHGRGGLRDLRVLCLQSHTLFPQAWRPGLVYSLALCIRSELCPLPPRGLGTYGTEGPPNSGPWLGVCLPSLATATVSATQRASGCCCSCPCHAGARGGAGRPSPRASRPVRLGTGPPHR